MKKENIQFSFSWKAMQLLGKSLYSNAWSAVSELVANGLDAGARNVYVLINVSNKSSSVIEITDDGVGMDREGLTTYAKVGYDRRTNKAEYDPLTPEEVMGRKGIGKLAALYLTENYCIKTRHGDTETTWKINRGTDHPDDIPYLEEIDNGLCTPITPKWSNLSSGTILVMKDVNLSGIGNAGFDALSARLANQFLTSSMGDRIIKLCVLKNSSDAMIFKPVEKNVAFRNFSILADNFDIETNVPNDIKEIEQSGNYVEMPLSTSKNDDLIKRLTVLESLDSLQDDQYPIEGLYKTSIDSISDKKALQNRKDVIVENEYVGIPYKLTGWLGVHSTIKSEIARKNDARFEKNRFYNPAQIRLYVRNKLASDELLNKLGITVASANYIEGEISFDLLDDNLLPDIATSSRQGFDELDQRWELLKNIIRPIVRQLINERSKISTELKEKLKQRQDSAKSEAYKAIRGELANRENLNETEKTEIEANLISQFQGSIDLEAKEDYKVFLSHRSKDKIFTDFIINLLKARGARRHEFFYTSSDYDPERLDDSHPLSEQIKRNIISDNTLIAYFTSPHFLESQYCLFEGGAGWATRSVSEYLLMSTTYDGIPKYLTNNKSEMIVAPDEKIELDEQTYHYFVRFLNRIIEHLNTGRRIKGESNIELFIDQEFPDKVEMKAKGTTPKDYMNKMFLDYWDEYVAPNLSDYAFREEPNSESTDGAESNN